MSQQVQSVENMHHDHVHWRSEALAWQEDLDRWREEYNEVRSVVTDLQELVDNHERALLGHAEVVESGDRRMAVHEAKLAEFLQAGKVAPLEEMFDIHTRESDQHLEQRALHEKIKLRHYYLMSRLRDLRHVLRATS